MSVVTKCHYLNLLRKIGKGNRLPSTLGKRKLTLLGMRPTFVVIVTCQNRVHKCLRGLHKSVYNLFQDLFERDGNVYTEEVMYLLED